MKITGLRVFLINPQRSVTFGTGWGKNTVLVKIYTDAGIDGLGEAFGTGKAKTTEAALNEFERWLCGKDPTEVLRNWYAYYRGSRYPLGTATMAALSAVEQALWDISGKACGLPVYRMLGGPTRDRIRLYASGILTQNIAAGPGPDGKKDLVSACQMAIQSGFTAVKFTPQPDDYEGKNPHRVLTGAVERVQKVREAIGDEHDICLDYHGRSFSPSEAIQLAQRIEQYRPLFLEEPALTEAPISLAEVKMKTTIPVAGGERCISRDRLRDLLEKNSLHVFQPEPTANGGIMETVKWAATCELYHVVLAPHHACGPVSLLSCAHIDASINNFLIQELNIDLSDPWLTELYSPLPQIKDGHLCLPERPGLGIELNEEAAQRYPYKPYDRPVIKAEDGSIGLE